MKFVKKTKSLLYGMEFSHGVRRALMGALALLYFISFGFDVVSVTTLFSISTLIMLFFEFPTGAIADYDSRKKSIMIGFFLISLAFFGLFIFSNFWILAGSWILGDIAWTFCSGAQGAWAIDALNYGKKKSKILPLISKGYFSEKSGYVIGGLIGLVVVAINFKFVWLIVSLLYLLMFFIIAVHMEERNFNATATHHGYLVKSFTKAKESFAYLIHKKNKELRVLLTAGSLSTISISSFFITVPLVFTKFFNLNPGYVSGIYSLTAVLALVGPVIAEKWANKKGFRIPLFILFLIMWAAIIIFGMSKLLLLSIIMLVLLKISLASSDVIQDSAYHHEFDDKIRASLGSLSNIIWAVSFSVSVFLTGVVITYIGLISAIMISGTTALITSLIYLIGLKKEKGKNKEKNLSKSGFHILAKQ